MLTGVHQASEVEDVTIIFTPKLTYTVNQADIHSETSLHYSPAFESWGSPQGFNYDTNIGAPPMLCHMV